MKHTPPTRFPRWAVPAVTVDRRLLDAIVGLLAQRCQGLTISSGEYEYDSVDELVAHAGTRPTALHLRTTKPRVTLELERRLVEGSLHADASPEGEAVFFRLREMLSDRKRLLGYMPGFPWILAISVALVVLLAALPRAWFASVGSDQQRLLVSAVIYGPIVLDFLARTGYVYVINLAPPATTSFWSRKKDDILLLLLGALLGAAATWLIGR